MGTALVTGAASGMGQATAAMFLDRGWRVLGLDITANLGIDHPALTALTVDIRDGEAVSAVVGAAVASTGIDAVANIAGVYPPTTLQTFTVEHFRTIFDVNVLGLLHVTRAAVAHMNPGSAIVNFASVDAFTVSPGQLLYGASKAAVVMLTKELALELAPRGIRVNGIAPGWVDTPGNAATGRMAEAAASIPLALDHGVRSGQVKKGETLLLEGVGGGFTWGAAVVRF